MSSAFLAPESDPGVQAAVVAPSTWNPKPSTHSFQKSLFCNRRARCRVREGDLEGEVHHPPLVLRLAWVGRRQLLIGATLEHAFMGLEFLTLRRNFRIFNKDVQLPDYVESIDRSLNE